jgi:multiple sugar transport system substrate-binding protein
MVSTPPQKVTRSALLRRAGAAAAAVAVGGAKAPYAFAGPLGHSGRQLAGRLSIVQWAHFVPRYDAWLRTWANDWGERNDVEVAIEREPYTGLPALAAAEVKAQRGHDIFGFLAPPARYEDQVIDHSSIVSEIERQVGRYGELGRGSTFNPRTRKYFGVADYFVPSPIIWRHDLWESVGQSPATWENVRQAAPLLKQLGHPIGLGQASEPDSNVALLSLLMCFGSFLQDASGAPALDSPNTVEAVEFMADLHARGQEDAVLSWQPESNNQLVLGGRGSLVMNAISAIRRAEDLGLPFSRELWLWPVPQGPLGRHAVGQYTGVYAIWKFARNREAAERFVADLCIASSDAVGASGWFNFPTFPGAAPWSELYAAAAKDTRRPKGKYSILTTIAAKYTRNAGYPGYFNAAVQEVLDSYLLPRMFAEVSHGRMTAAESVRTAAAEARRIWAKWRKAGKL